MGRELKYERGDWIAIPAPGTEGEYKPVKVVEADRERVVVSARFDDGEKRLTIEGDALGRVRRIRWRRQRGRARWAFA